MMFETEKLRNVHQKKHEIKKHQCEYCGKSFSSKANFQRHLVEKHNVFQHANNVPLDGTEGDEANKYECNICGKEFKYERNTVAHIHTIHYERD